MAKAQKRRAGGATNQQKGPTDEAPAVPDQVRRLEDYSNYDAATNPEAVELVRLGCAVFRLPSRAKKAKGEWPNAGMTDAEKARNEFRADDNIGVLLGAPSGMLADVDCDCPEAVALAGEFLPPTMVVFGRASNLRSHWICRTAEHACGGKVGALPFKDVDKSKNKAATTLVELRVGNANEGDDHSAYTVFPGSVNAGEVVEWDPARPDEIPILDGDDLNARVHKLAAATLLARHWPKKPSPGESGVRHHAARALTGFLHRCAGWGEEEIRPFVGAVARTAGDEEWKSRIRTTPADDIASPVAGRGQLAEHFGKAVALAVQRWLCKSDGEADEVDEHPWLVERLSKNAVVMLGGKARIATWKKFRLYDNSDHEVFEPIDRKDFITFNEDKFVMRTSGSGKEHKVLLANVFLERARRFNNVVFEPMQKAEDDVLNLWPPERGFGVKQTKGCWDLFKGHILNVIANGDRHHYDYILRWCAWAVQNPHKPAEVALVLRGGRRAGKGLFARAMCRLFGAYGWHAAGSKALTSEFNGHLIQVAMLFADEAFWAGDKVGEQLLKRMLTEDTLEIRPLFVGKFLIRNCLHVIMASNNDWVVPAGHDEGRFAVFDVSNKWAGPMTPEKKAYFDPLYAELANGGLEAFLQDLLAMELGTWHPRDAVPETEALRQQKEGSMPPADELVELLINRGSLPDAVPEFLHIAPTDADPTNQHYGLWGFAKRELGWKCPSPVTLGKALRNNWGVTDGRRSHHNQLSRSREWISGKKFPPLHQLRRDFENKYGRWSWDNPDQRDWLVAPPEETETSDKVVPPEAVEAKRRKKRGARNLGAANGDTPF